MATLLVIQSTRLRVEFVRRGDRFAHRVLVDDEGGQWIALLESIEGTPDEDWPPSPPWQEVHCERRGDLQIALAVGKAGSSHWSASFKLSPPGTLVVDVACRAGARPPRLGCCYRLLAPADLDSSGIIIVGRCILRPDVNATARHEEHRDSPTELSIGPVLDSEGDWPRTVRWSYTIKPANDPCGP